MSGLVSTAFLEKQEWRCMEKLQQKSLKHDERNKNSLFNVLKCIKYLIYCFTYFY